MTGHWYCCNLLAPLLHEQAVPMYLISQKLVRVALVSLHPAVAQKDIWEAQRAVLTASEEEFCARFQLYVGRPEVSANTIW